MNRAVEKLVRTLERLLTLYRELLACSREKTDRLVACDTEAIERAQGHEEMIVGKLSQVSEMRDAALREAADATMCKDQPPTLSAIILAMGGDEEGRALLLDLRAALKETGKELGAVNRLNEQLCTQSLTHLDVFMGLLTGRTTKAAVYNSWGKVRRDEGRALLSRSA